MLRNPEKFEPKIEREKKKEEIDYSQEGLVGLEIEKPVKVEGNAFKGAKEIKAKMVEAGKDAFWEAKNSLITKEIEAMNIGISSRGVVILGEVKGEVFPSVILMKGKLEKEKPEEIESFFQEELKKSQQGKESIFDYLFYFINWEGKSLKEGEEKLKERYEKIKEKGELLNELQYYSFYFLLTDNSRREEVLFGFEELRKVKKATLEDLNDYLPELEKVKDYLSVLSLKDWLRLGEYSEFLDFKTEKIKEIEKSFEEINLEEILKNPERFKKLKTAKRIKEYQAKGKEIKKELTEKELQKEIKDKKNHALREYLLNSPPDCPETRIFPFCEELKF